MGRSRLTVRQAAEAAGVPVRTMRRRVVALHAEHGGILWRVDGRKVARVRSTRVKLMIDVEALAEAHLRHPDQNDVEHEYLSALVRDLSQKVEALRKSHNRLKRRVDSALWQ